MKQIVTHVFGALAAFALLPACSSAPTGISVPTLSALTLTPSVPPGGTEVATFNVSNSAGVGSLGLTVVVTSPGGTASPPETSPLTVSGESIATEAEGSVSITIPTTATAGTYSISVTVTDGVDTSNVLTGTFDVT